MFYMFALMISLGLSAAAQANDNRMEVYTATWCAPCVRYHKILDRYDVDLPLVFVDIDACKEQAKAHKVTTVPITIWFIQNREVKRESGVLPLQRVRSISHDVLRKAKSSAHGVAEESAKAVAAVAGLAKKTTVRAAAFVLTPLYRERCPGLLIESIQ